MFADFILKDCPLHFNQDHIDKCRDRIALSIMRNCAIDDSYSQVAVTTATLSNTLAAQAAVATSVEKDKHKQLLADFGKLSSKASTKTEDYLHKKLRFYLLKGLDRWICTSCRVEVSSLMATCQLCKSYIPFVPLTCAEFENFAVNMGWGMPHWGRGYLSGGYATPYTQANNLQRYSILEQNAAKAMLIKDVEDGIGRTMRPQQLWESREEYQAFPYEFFCKQVYEVRQKALAGPYWQVKRNKSGKELHRLQTNDREKNGLWMFRLKR
jgi:hypothetical protein